MISYIKWAMILAICLYLLGGIYLYLNQAKFLYFPTPPNYSNQIGTRIYDINDQSIVVHAQNTGQTRAIIYFGGNGEAVANNIPFLSGALKHYTTYFVNYRGYGGSSGKPSQKALYADALELYDQISIDYSNISVIGRSLGTGIATYLAANRDIDKLVLITPYDSILSVAQQQFSIYPLKFMLRDQYRSIDNVKQIKSPTLMMLAKQDRIIPVRHAQNLAQAYDSNNLRVEVFEQAGHNSISGDAGFLKSLQHFLQKH